MTPAFFWPHHPGFVGRSLEASNPQRRRVNEGNQFTLTQPNLVAGVLPRQQCPGMIGPVEKMFYCTSVHAGYCDRRSGACMCHYGYRGDACEHCAFTHYRDPESEGNTGKCLPKILCENDCSGAGQCDYTTGKCKCDVHRVGSDCSKRFCADKFDPRCLACDTNHCSLCSDGFYIEDHDGPDRDSCKPCTDWDPRCIFCDSEQCLVCGDPLLSSIRRSGARRDDTPLEFDEWVRELSFALPFGTQSRYAFEEAEPFVVTPPGTPPLGERSQSCAQGTHNDWNFECTPKPVSHVQCGHAGTFSFSSPTFSVWENATAFRMGIQRTGGGMGRASVAYYLLHGTTGWDDVSATAQYTSEQLMVFDDGVVEKTFLVMINDDTTVEANETFALVLQNPTDGAVLGPQRQTWITIHDDDSYRVNHLHSTAYGPGIEEANIAGEVSTTRIVAGTPDGSPPAPARFYVDLIDMPAKYAGTLGANGTWGEYDYTINGVRRQRMPLLFDVSADDEVPGEYTVEARPLIQGEYGLVVQLATPGGLLGEYFDNAYLYGERGFYRVDHVVNFTWFGGRITELGTDYVSARFTGKVLMPPLSGSRRYTFYVDAKDNCRLWVNYELLIDRWSTPCGFSHGIIRLTGDTLYDIRLEYRHRTGNAHVQLYWSNGVPGQEDPRIIEKDALHVPRHIRGSPFPFEVISSTTNTLGTYASGPGLLGTTAGVTTYFDIHPRDEYRNKRLARAADDLFTVHLRLRDIDEDTERPLSDGFGAEFFEGKVAWDPEEYTFHVEYTPELSGTYDLEVRLRTGVATFRDIVGSPFRVEVAPAKLSGITSDIWGTGVSSGTAGETFPFNVRGRDLHYNLRMIGGEPDEIRVVALQTSWRHQDIYHEAALQGNSGVCNWVVDGDYDCAWWPTAAGTHVLSVTIGGNHIDESPYTVEVDIAEPHGGTSVADGIGLTDCTSNELVSFTVYVRDPYGNPRDSSGGAITAVLSGPATVVGFATHNGDGTVLVEYTPTAAGVYDLDVEVDGMPIIGSPFSPLAVPGVTFGIASSAEGHGLTDAMAGVEDYFVVTARDLNGNVKQTWQEDDVLSIWLEVDVDVVNDDGVLVTEVRTVHGNYTSVGDGQYQCRYTATVAKTHNLYVEINGEPIIGSPFTPVVVPAPMSGPHSLATGTGLQGTVAGVPAPVVVTAVDEFDNLLHHNGDLDVMRAWLDGADDVAIDIVDLENGDYDLTWLPVIAGDYTLHIDLMTSGGLTAVYYQHADFLRPVATLIDSHIDFNWKRTVAFGSYDAESGTAGTSLDNSVAHPDFVAGGTATHEEILQSVRDHLDNAEVFSIRWQGFVRPEFDEWYTFVVDLDGDVRLWIGDDLLIDAWPADTVQYRASRRLNAHEFYPIKVEYRSHVGESRIGVSWYSTSFAPADSTVLPAPEIITGEHFWLQYAVTGGTFSPHVVPAPTSSSNCEAWGTGLHAATANIESSFIVHVRDEFNNTRRVGGDLVQAVAERTGPLPHPDGADFVQFECDVEDLGDATFLVTYVPVVSGTYSLRVTVNAPPVHSDFGPTAVRNSVEHGHIQDSPFVLKVSDGERVGATSTAEGAGLAVAEAGVETGFTVQARDVNSNHRQSLDSVSVRAVRDTPAVSAAGFESEVVLTGVATYGGDGFYTIRYTPTDSGNFQLNVLIDGEHIVGSPFDLVVYPTYAEGSFCTAYEPQLTPVSREVAPATVGSVHEFVIRSKDRFDNYLDAGRINGDSGGDKYVVRALGPQMYPKPIRGLVVDNGDATYTASFTPEIAGPYLVHVWLARSYVHQTGLTGEYYSNQWMRGDPAVVRVDPFVDFDWSSPGGEGDAAHLITEGWGAALNSVRWTGYIEPEHPEFYTFHVVADDGARLWIGEELLVDALHDGAGEWSQQTSFRMLPGTLYEVRLEYRQVAAQYRVSLQWQSTNTARGVVPTAMLYPSAEEIKDSPFDVLSSDA